MHPCVCVSMCVWVCIWLCVCVCIYVNRGSHAIEYPWKSEDSFGISSLTVLLDWRSELRSSNWSSRAYMGCFSLAFIKFFRVYLRWGLLLQSCETVRSMSVSVSEIFFLLNKAFVGVQNQLELHPSCEKFIAHPFCSKSLWWGGLEHIHP